MSKGSLFWSKARGKLGDVVLSQLKGQQIARAYQPRVANPRTTKQTDQRILFANAVKFYKHATQNLFEFAYEDKRSNESYYNAFMRKNAKVSMIPTRTMYLNKDYPAIGDLYLMSEGSLAPLPFKYDSVEDSFSLSLGKATAAEQNLTVGEVSQALINKYNLSQGDIITFVHITAAIDSITTVPSESIEWTIGQIVIDTSIETSFHDYLTKQNPYGSSPFFATKAESNECSITGRSDAGAAIGACIIVSRKTTEKKLLFSTNYLLNNNTADNIYQASLESGFRNAALNSWGRTAAAVLQGGIVEQS